jgi:hypothetical protein
VENQLRFLQIGKLLSALPEVQRPYGNIARRKKGKQWLHQASVFLRAISTWRRLNCLKLRAKQGYRTRAGKMVTPALFWIVVASFSAAISGQEMQPEYPGQKLERDPKSRVSGLVTKRGLPLSEGGPTAMAQRLKIRRGNGACIVVDGVTTIQGVRESHTQGEGKQVYQS